MKTETNYYELLQIDKKATEAEIRKAYRKLARYYQPDDNSPPEDIEMFHQIQKAYEILIDPQQRRIYDHRRRTRTIDKTSTITLWTIVSHKYLLTNLPEQAFYVLVDIVPAVSLATTRLPVNLGLVLDRSTSMQGMRLQQVKEGARQIIDQLNPDDSLSIIVFSDRAETIFSAQKNINKAVAKSITSTIQPSGGTEILRGLTAGLEAMEKNRSPQSINHLILLTDGQTYGDEEVCLEKAQQAGQEQISLTTMGIGSDWNEELLDRMSSLSGGNSIYIDSPRKVVTAFKETIRNLNSVVIRQLTMNLQPEPGVTIQEAFQVMPHIRRLDIEAADIMLGPLGTDQGKSLLLECRIDRINTTGSKRLVRLTVKGDKTSQLQHGVRNWEATDLIGEFVPSLDGKPTIPPTIVTALGKLAIFKMQEKAMSDLAKGQISAATQRLETMATRLLNLGETELARAALLEAGRLARTGDLSAEGKKKIHYGTRALSTLPKEIHNND